MTSLVDISALHNVLSTLDEALVCYPPALLLNDWRARYIQGLNAANTGNYGLLLNLIGQSVEAGLDLYLEACAITSNYQPLRELSEASGYPLEYLSWLARQGRLDVGKRKGSRWHPIMSKS